MRTIGTVINTILFLCNLVCTALSVLVFIFSWDYVQKNFHQKKKPVKYSDYYPHHKKEDKEWE